MAETGTMSEQKRLAIAWGTTFAMMFSATVAGNVVRPQKQPEAEAILAAHQNFQQSVAVDEKTTSLKPQVEVADEMPKLDELAEAANPGEASVSPITALNDDADSEAASTPTPVDSETADEPAASIETAAEEPASAPEIVEASEPIVQEGPELLEPANTATTSSDLTEELEVEQEPQLVVEMEAVTFEDPETMPATDVGTNVALIETAEASDLPDVVATDQPDVVVEIDTPANGASITEPPIVEAETATESVIETESAVADVAPPVTLPTVEADPVLTPEASSAEQVPASTAAEVQKSQAKPFFGVGIRNANDNVVTTIYAGSTAQTLGMKLGDRLVSVNGKPVSNVETLRAVLQGFEVDTPTTVEIQRAGTTYKLGPKPLGSR